MSSSTENPNRTLKKNQKAQASKLSNAAALEKLSEARRLFSLRHYAQCRELVSKILEIDPRNHAAKGLLELTALQMTPPKEKATAEPEPVAVFPLPETALNAREISGKQKAPVPPRMAADHAALSGSNETPSVQGEAAPAIDPQFSFLLAAATESNSTPSRELSETTAANLLEADSMRERTISALVDLFNQKDKTLKDWRDPRFRETFHQDPAASLRDLPQPAATSDKKGRIAGFFSKLFQTKIKPK